MLLTVSENQTLQWQLNYTDLLLCLQEEWYLEWGMISTQPSNIELLAISNN